MSLSALRYGDPVAIRRDASMMPGAGSSSRAVIGTLIGENVEGDGSWFVTWPETSDWRSEKTMRLWGADLRPLSPEESP